MRTNKLRAFTVVELLVVVAIIALLVGILLPAIGKARDAAQTSQSQSNLRQLATAWQTYAGEFGDRQMTYINDYISQYNFAGGPSPGPVIATNYASVNGQNHPPVVIGYLNSGANMVTFQIGWDPNNPPAANAAYIYSQPMNLVQYPASAYGKGSFRFFNTRALTTYLNGRNYDPVLYAPKDRVVLNAVEQYFDDPSEAISVFNSSGSNILFWPSYCLSPAAMWNPDVLSEQHGAANFETALLFNNPWQMPAGFKSPALSQARYANLKTLFIEHNWLQNNKRSACNPAIAPGGGSPYGCEPWYYNASILSNPMCVFYDGHVGSIGVRDAMDSNQRVLAQHNQTLSSGTKGLWSKNTPLAGVYEPPSGVVMPTNGYWQHAWAADGAATSFHILTSYGIKGRDIIPK